MPDQWVDGPPPKKASEGGWVDGPPGFVAATNQNPMDNPGGNERIDPRTTPLGKMVAPLGKPLSGIANLAQRPFQARRSGLYAGGPLGFDWQAFIHGVSPEQAQRDNDARYKWLGFDQNTGARGFVDRFAADVIDDPLSLLGMPLRILKGRSLMGHALEMADRHISPAILKAADKMAAPLKAADNPNVRHIPDIVSGVHDLGVDSKIKRELMRQYGSAWKSHYAAAYGVRNAGHSAENALVEYFQPRFDAITKGMSHADQDAMFKAIYSKRVDKLSPALQAKALEYRKLTNTMSHMQGDATVQHMVSWGGGRLGNTSRKVEPWDFAYPNIGKPAAIQDSAALDDSPSIQNLFNPPVHGPFNETAARASWQEYIKNPDTARGLTKLTPQQRQAAEDAYVARVKARSMDAVSDAPLRDVEWAGRGSKPSYGKFTVKQRAKRPFDLPPELRQFQTTTPRGIQLPEEFLTDYVATSAKSAKKTDAASRTVSHLDPKDSHLLPQEGYVSPENTIEGTRSRVRTFAKSIAAHDARARMASMYGGQIPSWADEFFTKSFKGSDDMNALEKAGRLAQTVTDFDKGGLFALPFRHMANEASHALIEDPGALLSASASGLKSVITRESSAARAARLRPSIHAGATVTQAFDRQTPFVAAIKKAGDKVGDIPIVGKLAAIVPNSLHALYKGSAGVLWAFSDELRHASFKSKVASGMPEFEAALQTGADLVDYSNRSGLSKGISSVVPFATWRTKAPQVAARLMFQNPGRVNAAARAWAPFVGGTDANGDTSSLPFAEAATLTEGPNAKGHTGAQRYVRGSLGPILKVPITAGEDALSPQPGPNVTMSRRGGRPFVHPAKKPERFWTSGKSAGEYGLYSLPGMMLLDLLGKGMYPKTPEEALKAQLGIYKDTRK